MDSVAEDADKASTPKKRKLCRRSSQEEMTAQIRNENREGQKHEPPPSSLSSHNCVHRDCVHGGCD